MLDKSVFGRIKGHISGDGYVNTCGMKRKDYDFNDFFILHTLEGDKMFGKVLSEKVLIDAEVLMSAVYDKMGIKTPMYLPFMQRRDVGVVSEYVGAHDPTAKTVYEVQKQQGIRVYNQFYIKNLISNPDMQKLLTKDAIGDIVSISHMDVASKNTDRSMQNLMLGSRQADGRYGSGISIDYGACADRYAMFRRDKDDYYITMDEQPSGRLKYIAKMCAIEDWYGYITPMEFISKLDGIDVREVAREIKQTYGYELDKKYVDYVYSCHKDFIETTNDFLSTGR